MDGQTICKGNCGQLAFNPIAGLLALPLAVEGPGEVKLSLRVSAR